MPRPLILISTGRTMLPSRGDDAQAVKVGCDADYVAAVIRAGGAPLLLPPHGDRAATRDAIGAADALLLSGGGDVHSLCYGAQPHPKSRGQDATRDATELSAVDFALKKGLPILGIARGAQLLNVARGGTLIQHLPGGIEGTIKHNSEGLAGLLLHSIQIETGSAMHELFGTSEMAVNSFHHQAIDRLGSDLKVTARALDGVIEAIESADENCLGVQFHPEECALLYPSFDAIFSWLVKRAR